MVPFKHPILAWLAWLAAVAFFCNAAATEGRSDSAVFWFYLGFAGAAAALAFEASPRG